MILERFLHSKITNLHRLFIEFAMVILSDDNYTSVFKLQAIKYLYLLSDDNIFNKVVS